MNVANKYLVAGGLIGGLVLVIIAYATLYQIDYRALLANNPDKIAVLIDYNASNRLEIITRGRDWALNQEVLRIRYNEQETTLYSNTDILARSQWRVETKGGTLQERSYTAGTTIDYQDFGDSFNIRKILNYQRKHVLTESQIFSSKISIENFPEKYYIKYEPFDSREYKLTWIISNLRFFDWQKQGTITDCTMSFVGNLKVDWCNSKDKIDYVYLSKQYFSLYVHFKPAKGTQNFDVSLIDPIVFDGLYYRNRGGIFINTFITPVRVSGQDIKLKLGYDTENVSVPYKFARMLYWIEYDLPFVIDLCDGTSRIQTSYPTSTYINWDYNVFVPNYRNEVIDEPCAKPFDDKSCFIDDGIDFLLVFCDVRLEKDVCSHTIQVEDGTYNTITRSHPVALSDMHNCPLERGKRYNLYHYAEIPLGERIVFDVSLELSLPLSLDKATFVIPAPSWISAAASDYNTGNAFDFNWTKVTWDGNIMPVGDDRIHNDQNQAFYDQNLVAYWKLNDVNSTGNGIRDDTNLANNGQLFNGADINAWGLWDTNALFLDGVNDYVEVADNASIEPKEITISMWVKPTAWTGSTADAIIAKRLSISSGYLIFRLTNTNTINIDFGTSATRWNTGYLPPTGRWTHIVYDYNGTHGNFYVNGDLNGSTTNGDTTKVASTFPLRIGADTYLNQYYFKGAIEEVKIYNRALSTAEIQADYNSWMHSNYLSPVKDAGSAVNWDAMDWNAFVDVNNNVTVDYRGCSTADCSSAGAWMGGFKSANSGNLQTNIYADGNRYFQYRLSFDTNRQQWNTVRSPAIADGDKGKFGHVSNVWASYSSGEAPTTCDCPASGNWEINDGSVCTLATVCSLTTGSLHISNGSLTVTTGTLSIPTGYKIIIEKTNSKLVVVKPTGKVIINK